MKSEREMVMGIKENNCKQLDPLSVETGLVKAASFS